MNTVKPLSRGRSLDGSAIVVWSDEGAGTYPVLGAWRTRARGGRWVPARWNRYGRHAQNRALDIDYSNGPVWPFWTPGLETGPMIYKGEVKGRALQVQEGHFYRARNGAIYGPMRRVEPGSDGDADDYPWADPLDGDRFTDDGRYACATGTDGCDLIVHLGSIWPEGEERYYGKPH